MNYEFGFGFFNLLYVGDADQDLSFDQYLKEIEATFKGIRGVSDFEIRTAFRPWETQRIPAESPDVASGASPFPDMEQTALMVQFRLNVPEVVQEELIDPDFFQFGTEDFRVVYFCGFNGPSVIVFPLESSGAASGGVAVTREYLAKELALTMHLRLQVIGPTPYPVNCYLRPGEHIGSRFVWSWKEQSGYDEITYEYDAERYSDEGKLFLYFIPEVGGEIGQYYWFERWNERIENEWASLEYKILELAIDLRDANFYSRIRSLFRYGRNASVLGLELAVLESTTIKDDATMRTIIREAESEDMTSLLEVTRQLQIDRIAATPDQLEKLLSIVDATQSKRWNAIWPVLAALLGAIVGSHLL